LYALKQKICAVIQEFYARPHWDPTAKAKVKYPLTSHNSGAYYQDDNQYYQGQNDVLEIRPQDLIISSVNMYKFKFQRVFSEHVGHSLVDVASEVGKGSMLNHMFVHQLDPRAIDVDKCRHMEASG